jgi:four helix bundle protein
MAYKFQQLKVYQLALGYVDKVYVLSRGLPVMERFNLQNQLERAATSIVLNIAEGSTGQSNIEQRRFLGLALRSYLETVACFDIIERQGYLPGNTLMEIRELGHELFIKLQAFRKALACGQETKGGKETGDRRQGRRRMTEDGRRETEDGRIRSPVPSLQSISGFRSPVSRPQSSPEGES